MERTEVKLRPMTLQDVPTVWSIMTRSYTPDLHEPEDQYERKVAVYPQGCWVAELRDGDLDEPTLVGHVVSFPSRLSDPPALAGHEEWKIPAQPDAYFIHEVTVDPSRRGLGLGQLLCAKALECARLALDGDANGPRYVTLMSVQGSARFWHRQGGFLPYDFERNMLLTRVPDEQSDDEGHDDGPRIFDEETARRLKSKLEHSYGRGAVMMMARIDPA